MTGTEVGDSAPVEYATISESVAKLLHPSILLNPRILQAVEQALQASVQELRRDLTSHAKQIMKAEQRISDLEDEFSQTQAQVSKIESQRQKLMDKLEDLENRSRRNNLRIIGLFKTAFLNGTDSVSNTQGSANYTYMHSRACS